VKAQLQRPAFAGVLGIESGAERIERPRFELFGFRRVFKPGGMPDETDCSPFAMIGLCRGPSGISGSAKRATGPSSSGDTGPFETVLAS
jgi:hypothetical protein